MNKETFGIPGVDLVINPTKPVQATPAIQPEPETKSFWDFTGTRVKEASFIGDNEKLDKEFKKLKKHPNKIKTNFFFACLPIAFFFAVLLFAPQIISAIISSSDEGIYLLILPFAPAVIYYTRIKKLEIDLIKKLIAEEYNWIYSPKESYLRWSAAKSFSPKIFDKGTRTKRLEDEFWGNYKSPKQTVDFWSGLFTYETGSDKYRVKHVETVFAIRLNKYLTKKFSIVPSNAFRSVSNFFTKKDIDTESAKFNSKFDVEYDGTKIDNHLDIIKILSPAVQVQLLEFLDNHGSFSLFFEGSVFFIVMKGKLFSKMKTSFLLKGVYLHPEDRKNLEEKMNSMINISSQIVPYLD